MQPFDFNLFRQQVKEATQNALIEATRQYTGEVCAFALYSDEGVLTLSPAVNTLSYLQKQQAEDPDNTEYYQWSPAEWKNEGNLATEDFNQLSALLRNTVLGKTYTESFPRFRENVFETVLSVLEEMRKENWFQNMILVFTLTDYDNPRQESNWIKRLNDSVHSENFRLWRHSWG
ncbi:DUF4303 domain-containing protein [Cytophagaceae bacterium DM2B3-1]|uniref:DUF4303 domain-containing protein n=1 Tax=Xanthocytophaga flava TaxID=3048013 RepID=A0ABT7CVC5_9BACT|nr:DUF4303 domain-containing protein [Xanthocytophaga flavus]MDJ1497728.1 DUF4303 domain-containing protein [Xanthocytophaga flavus]